MNPLRFPLMITLWRGIAAYFYSTQRWSETPSVVCGSIPPWLAKYITSMHVCICVRDGAVVHKTKPRHVRCPAALPTGICSYRCESEYSCWMPPLHPLSHPSTQHTHTHRQADRWCLCTYSMKAYNTPTLWAKPAASLGVCVCVCGTDTALYMQKPASQLHVLLH